MRHRPPIRGGFGGREAKGEKGAMDGFEKLAGEVGFRRSVLKVKVGG